MLTHLLVGAFLLRSEAVDQTSSYLYSSFSGQQIQHLVFIQKLNTSLKTKNNTKTEPYPIAEHTQTQGSYIEVHTAYPLMSASLLWHCGPTASYFPACQTLLFRGGGIVIYKMLLRLIISRSEKVYNTMHSNNVIRGCQKHICELIMHHENP